VARERVAKGERNLCMIISRRARVRERRRICVAAAVALLAALLVTSCVVLTTLPRAVVQEPDGNLVVRSIPCSGGAPAAGAATPREALDPNAIRVISWNIHKQGDGGWDRDLARFAADADLLLLQEAVLSPPLRAILEAEHLRFTMASSFLYEDKDIGVLSAARVTPVAACTERVVEPWLRIPKSAMVSWFALRGTSQTLAVVNVHAINFSLSVAGYRAQFESLAGALRHHDGPILFAGDLNTWTDERLAVVREATAALELTEIPFAEDRRSLFLGHQLDHLLVRGLDVVSAAAIAVESSDHNPVLAMLRLQRR
jgi:endonuclease/exonuclease/phosphatase (EEP) superfamily protein YafD